MAAISTQLTLSQMVDLALNSPEIGIVNFNILHALLQVMVKQLELADCSVEFRGADSEKLQSFINCTKTGPSLSLTEYTVRSGGKSTQEVGGKRGKRKRTNLFDEKGKKDEDQSEKIAQKSSSVESFSTVVVVAKGSTDGIPPRYSVAVTTDALEKVQREIKQLQADMRGLKELPSNGDLIKAIRRSSVGEAKKSDSSPVLDMFQILNLTKRMDATDITLEKLFSMVEELTGKTGERDGPVEHAGKESIESNYATQLEHRIDEIEKTVDNLKSMEFNSETTDSNRPAGCDLIQLLKDVDYLKGLIDDEKRPPETRLVDVEVKFKDLLEQINHLDTAYSEQIQTLQSRLGRLEKEIGGVLEKINLGLPAGDAVETGEQSVAELYKQLVKLEEEMANLNEIANNLVGDKQVTDDTLNIVREQVELLKTLKANKEDLDDALAAKADACIINRKVSFSQFDAACDDLTKSIEDALSKLKQQEALWMQTLEDMQKEVVGKLDKNELAPLQDFINNKLKMLQSKMKNLLNMKSEHEAAGTKSKYLKDVNCISCDKNVVMRKQMDSSLMPRPYSMPAGKNIAPYLAYELDQLRKQQKCLPNSRNMNFFEVAVQSGGKTKKGKEHICNRYCGGSHTVTTPQQRVTRTGHFLEQWGPEIAPLKETLIKGSDGHTYRGQEDPKISPPKEHIVANVEVAEEEKIVEKEPIDTPRPRTSNTGRSSAIKSGSVVQKRKLSSAEKPIKPVKSGSKILKPASGEKVAMEPIPENTEMDEKIPSAVEVVAPPVEEAPAPTEEVPAPVAEVVAPVNESPTLEEENPAPVEEVPVTAEEVKTEELPTEEAPTGANEEVQPE